jgi:hypothetical protein
MAIRIVRVCQVEADGYPGGAVRLPWGEWLDPILVFYHFLLFLACFEEAFCFPLFLIFSWYS